MEEVRAGYNPELSYGSHIFQDLVEAEILYTAVFNNNKTLHFAPEKFRGLRNMLEDIDENSGLDEVIKVYDVSRCNQKRAFTYYYLKQWSFTFVELLIFWSENIETCISAHRGKNHEICNCSRVMYACIFRKDTSAN